MATDEQLNTDNVPMLSSVIEAGDESVIQTKRISHQIGTELDANLGPLLSREIIEALAGRSAGSMADHAATVVAEDQARTPEYDPDPDETLELMIDDIVDRHITALRQDIRSLLERAIAKQ